MATFLDVSGLAYFSSFFVFVFVWLAVYALLQYTKVLGANKGIDIIIGLVIGLLVLFSPIATSIVEVISPWFAVVFVFILFATLAMKFMGASSADIAGGSSFKLLVGIVVLTIIVVGAIGQVRQKISVPGENETTTEYTKSNVIFHPKLLGAIFVLAIAVFTIALLAGRQK